MRVLPFAAAAAVVSLAAHPAFAQSRIVQTQYGQVQGIVVNGVSEYLGIPYASPPVGALRWAAPTPPHNFNGVRQTTQFSSSCPQPVSQFGRPSTNEDCLYLNVYVPPGTNASSKLPVMTWIHGGAFITGEGSDYDGSALATEGHVIVVTINYRLGLLGFLAHPALAALDPHGSSGDYGLEDQQAALTWVAGNIAGFGGDPARNTIFGESAGGASVSFQLVSPTTPKVHGAIIESGAYARSLPTLAASEATGEALAAASPTAPTPGLGCPDQTASCLRSVPVSTIVGAVNALTGSVSPDIDNYVLPTQPLQAYNAGTFQHVPIINGTNHDEYRLFVALNDFFGTGPLTADEYTATIEASFGTLASAVLAEYPLANYASPNYAYAALVTDYSFACGGHLLNGLAAQYTPVYSYELNDPNAPDLFLPPDPNLPDLGDSHASELPYLYPALTDPLFGLGPVKFTPSQAALAKGMRASWTSLATYGRPLNPRGGAWLRYSTAQDGVLSLVPPSPRMGYGFVEDHNCDFWKPVILFQAGLPGTVPY